MSATLREQISALAKLYQSESSDIQEIEQLASKIMDNIPDHATDEEIPALIKAHSINHQQINLRCLESVGRYLCRNAKPLKKELFLNGGMLKIFKQLIQSSNIHFAHLSIKALRCLKQSSPVNDDTFIDLVTDSDLIPLCVQQLTSKDPDIRTEAACFMTDLFRNDEEVKLREICLKSDILANLRSLYVDPYSSDAIRWAVTSVISSICIKEAYENNLYAPQILDAFGLILFWEDSFATIKVGFFHALLTKMVNPVPMQINPMPMQMNIEFIEWDKLSDDMVDSESLTKYFREKAMCDKLLFDRTMQKYLSQHCDFEVPIVIRQLIENYYTLCTTKTVKKMEFDLLKRFVELTDEKYCDQTKIGSLYCMNELIEIGYSETLTSAGSEMWQYFADNGFLDNVKDLLSSNDSDIVSPSLNILSDAVENYLDFMLETKIIDVVWSIALDYPKDKKSACRALIVLFRVIFIANDVQVKALYKQGIVSDLYQVLSGVIDEVSLNESGWGGFYDVTRRILNNHHNDSKIRDLILNHFKSCDQTKAWTDEDNKRHLENLMDICKP